MTSRTRPRSLRPPAAVVALPVALILIVAGCSGGGGDDGEGDTPQGIGDHDLSELDEQRVANANAALSACIERATGIRTPDDFLITGDVSGFPNAPLSPQDEAAIVSCVEQVFETLSEQDLDG
ncbi:MAG: hypothetical protein AAF962_02130 [Actinomycetota bacterium]